MAARRQPRGRRTLRPFPGCLGVDERRRWSHVSESEVRPLREADLDGLRGSRGAGAGGRSRRTSAASARARSPCCRGCSGGERMSHPLRIVVVGGVAGGASAAARARRLSETAEIIVFERGPHVSFANCGLPYHIGGRDRRSPAAAGADAGEPAGALRAGRAGEHGGAADRPRGQGGRGPGAPERPRVPAGLRRAGAEPRRRAAAAEAPRHRRPARRTLRNLEDMDAILETLRADRDGPGARGRRRLHRARDGRGPASARHAGGAGREAAPRDGRRGPGDDGAAPRRAAPQRRRPAARRPRSRPSSRKASVCSRGCRTGPASPAGS